MLLLLVKGIRLVLVDWPMPLANRHHDQVALLSSHCPPPLLQIEDSLLLVMPAGAYAGTLQLIVPWLCYKYSNLRSWLIFACQLGTTLAALLLWLLPRSQTGALLFACYILPSVGGGYAVLMGLQLANTAGYTKRSIASSGIYIGYCFGNFVGPLVFKPEDAPRYIPGFIVVTITAIAAGVLAVIYRFWCSWENKKRDNAGIMEGFEHAYDDDLTDRKVRSHFQSNILSVRMLTCPRILNSDIFVKGCNRAKPGKWRQCLFIMFALV